MSLIMHLASLCSLSLCPRRHGVTYLIKYGKRAIRHVCLNSFFLLGLSCLREHVLCSAFCCNFRRGLHEGLEQSGLVQQYL